MMNTALVLSLLLHGVGSVPVGAMVGPACWPHHDLIVVMEGQVNFSIGRSKIVCRGGDALLIPPNHEFRGLAGSDGATIWVQHFSSRKSSLVELPKVPVCWGRVGRWEWPRTLMRRLSRLQKARGEVRSDNPSALLLALLLEEFRTSEAETRSEPSNAERTISFIIDWIEHHALPLPSLKKIAASSGWSVNYFRDQFRAVTGQTVGEFLKQRRLGEAARLLVETRLPIKDIAQQADYAEAASFHRAFLARYRMTPGRYREQRVLAV
jgi:AraC family transcriptional regulator, mar-sox-rob regulon activator